MIENRRGGWSTQDSPYQEWIRRRSRTGTLPSVSGEASDVDQDAMIEENVALQGPGPVAEQHAWRLLSVSHGHATLTLASLRAFCNEDGTVNRRVVVSRVVLHLNSAQTLTRETLCLPAPARLGLQCQTTEDTRAMGNDQGFCGIRIGA